MGAGGLSHRLRPLHAGDASAIAAMLADRDVTRWLTAAPWPYSLADAETFLSGAAETETIRGIEVEGALAGVVSLHPVRGLGYWLGRSFWGRGRARAAAADMLARHFARSGGRADLVISGHHPGNDRSRAVLLSLGFRDTGTEEVPSAQTGGLQTIVRMRLDPADWAFARAPERLRSNAIKV